MVLNQNYAKIIGNVEYNHGQLQYYLQPLCLRAGFKKKQLLIKEIVEKLLEKKVVTQDLAETNSHKTSEVGDWILNEKMKY